MRVLVIHDREDIANELLRLTVTNVKGCLVEKASDVFGARDRLKTTLYDLVVIDLTLPIKQGQGEATLANAQFVLEEIFGGGDLQHPGDVLGISITPELLDVVSNTIGGHLMACIQEDSDGRWREKYASKLHYLMESRRARQLAIASSYDYDVAVITALDEEARPFHDIFQPDPIREFRNAREFSFNDRKGTVRRGVLFAVGASGQAATASATQAVLNHFRPKLFLMTGFCGGVEGRVSKGDLIAFSSSTPWDIGKWEQNSDGSNSRFRHRPNALNVEERGVAEIVRAMVAAEEAHSDELLGAVLKSSKGAIQDWKLRFKPAGSGSAVVTSLEKLSEIIDVNEDVRAIDMESFGFYHACRNTNVVRPDFLCVKSVADYCNGQKDNTLHNACSLISARFAADLIRNRYDFV
jgi:nucleoside phosphorylase